MKIPHERELLAFTKELKKAWPGSKRRRLRVWHGEREVWIAPFDRGRFVRIAAQHHDGRRPMRELTLLPEEIASGLAWAIAWVADPEAPMPDGMRGNETYGWSMRAARTAPNLSPAWLCVF